jgi:hypothetical protein
MKRKITLYKWLRDGDNISYKVFSLVNLTRPVINDIIREAEVSDLIKDGVKVKIIQEPQEDI